MDSGLSLDTSSEVFGEGSGCLALAVGDVKVRGGSSSVWGAGIKRAELRRERDGGDSFLDTVDSSIQQIYLHRTAFCALKHTRRGWKAVMYLVYKYSYGERIVVCFFGSVSGGGLGPCGLEVATSGLIKGGASTIPSFWLLGALFYAFSGLVTSCSFVRLLTLTPHATHCQMANGMRVLIISIPGSIFAIPQFATLASTSITREHSLKE